MNRIKALTDRRMGNEQGGRKMRWVRSAIDLK
jgi:hypothetical protein